ncbi:hypothetical protein AMTRI_Chr04g253190 [Amborella trichopoda]
MLERESLFMVVFPSLVLVQRGRGLSFQRLCRLVGVFFFFFFFSLSLKQKPPISRFFAAPSLSSLVQTCTFVPFLSLSLFRVCAPCRLSLLFVPYPLSFSLFPLQPGLPLSLNIEDEARRGEKDTNSLSL